MVHIIDGVSLADNLIKKVSSETEKLVEVSGLTPTIAVILVGADSASGIYVKRKVDACARAGIFSQEHRLSDRTEEEELLQLIDELNINTSVHGILVQLPLPKHIDALRVLDKIDPSKDVDGFHPVNVGRITIGKNALVPCTPLGCMMLLDTVVSEYRGLNAVVIGKSNIVGKPVALLLLERECTVTVTHIHTKNLPDIVRTADIVVVAAGSPGLVKGSWIKPGAIVIDVGINRIPDAAKGYKIVGDVVSDELSHAMAYTPVPGGVGPMTVACLLSNTVIAAKNIYRRTAGTVAAI